MNKRQMVVLWAGIAAFVLIGLFPPITDWYPSGPGPTADAQWVEYRVDTGRLVGYLAAVAAVTGGLLCTLRGKRGASDQKGRP